MDGKAPACVELRQVNGTVFFVLSGSIFKIIRVSADEMTGLEFKFKATLKKALDFFSGF